MQQIAAKPANAGIELSTAALVEAWIPAFAGMAIHVEWSRSRRPENGGLVALGGSGARRGRFVR
jgi:hypothetical protein